MLQESRVVPFGIRDLLDPFDLRVVHQIAAVQPGLASRAAPQPDAGTSATLVEALVLAGATALDPLERIAVPRDGHQQLNAELVRAYPDTAERPAWVADLAVALRRAQYRRPVRPAAVDVIDLRPGGVTAAEILRSALHKPANRRGDGARVIDELVVYSHNNAGAPTQRTGTPGILRITPSRIDVVTSAHAPSTRSVS